MNFYGMRKENGFLVSGNENCRLLIPESDVVSIALFILQGAKNGAISKKKRTEK